MQPLLVGGGMGQDLLNDCGHPFLRLLSNQQQQHLFPVGLVQMLTNRRQNQL